MRPRWTRAYHTKRSGYGDLVHPDTSARFSAGLALALFSAMAFGLSGTLAAGLLAAGWTPLGAVFFRIMIGTVILIGPAIWSLRGRWGLLRRNWQMIVQYGLIAVAGTQLCYFNAVQHLQVAQALLIQYLAPVALVFTLWLRRGERPTSRTIGGSVLAIIGLVLVLQVSAGAALNIGGLIWASFALVGNAVYFVISSDDRSGLPPLVLAGGGLLVGLIALTPVVMFGLLPFTISYQPVGYAGVLVPWWLPVLALGLVTSSLSYVTGIFGARLLGTRLSSFVGLSEVLFAVTFAALFVGQILTFGQVLGGVLVTAGVVLVKLGEARIESRQSAVTLSVPQN